MNILKLFKGAKFDYDQIKDKMLLGIEIFKFLFLTTLIEIGIKPIVSVRKEGYGCLSLVPTCPKNRKNQGFLRSSGVWDSYDQCEHPIPDIPDGRRVLRRDWKNRKHFYFEGTVPDGPRRSGIFRMSVNMKFACLGHRGCLILSLLATKA